MNNAGAESFRGLIDYDHVWISHKRPAQREHLLLAT